MAKPKLKRTLYIGLGGTGFKTLLRTKRTFIETYGQVPPMIKFLAIDANQNQYQEADLTSTHGDVDFMPSEQSDISVQNAGAIVQRHREQLSWLPEQNVIAVQNLTDGCGMVRTNGRIAFSLNYTKTRTNIENALTQILSLQNQTDNSYEVIGSDVEVNIVFSVGGGTGSGTFLDAAYMVKDIFRAKALPQTSTVIGYMVLPDVYDAQLQFNKERLLPTGYACLTDLDYMMHQSYDKGIAADYLVTQTTLQGAPFNTVFAISNRNLNGAAVNDCLDLADMIGLALVVNAGELSSGIQSVANNLEKGILGGNYNVGDKRAVMATMGMSEIIFQASGLLQLYKAKAAQEVVNALLAPGSNLDKQANSWIDTNQIRENKGFDQVIDRLLPAAPQFPFSGISNTANPKSDVDIYLSLRNVAVIPAEVSAKVDDLKNEIREELDKTIKEYTNDHGPKYAIGFIDQLKVEIDDCLKEMHEEKVVFENSYPRIDAAINSAIVDYQTAQDKFFNKKKNVAAAEVAIKDATDRKAVTVREIARRDGAISFYTWLIVEMQNAKDKLGKIEQAIKDVDECVKIAIGQINRQLRSKRGLFEVDLTEPYISKVSVTPDSVNLNQFMMSLPEASKVYNFDGLHIEDIVKHIFSYTDSMSAGQTWENLSAEDALCALPKEEREAVIRNAIELSSPMCPLNYQGHLSPTLYNYYYIGVADQTASRMTNISQYLPGGQPTEVTLATIGSKDRIVFYHLYGVFPTFAIAGFSSYDAAHARYNTQQKLAYSFHFDEDLRTKMERDGFSVYPKEQTDDSLEMWVKGLIFGLIIRDEDGVYKYKDRTNKHGALSGYWISLGTKYRDEAFRNFKRESERLRLQYESILSDRIKAEGRDAINAMIADARETYFTKYSLNDLSQSELERNQLYAGIANQLNDEIDFATNHLE